MGDEPFPMNAVADIGKVAAALFDDPSTIGTSVGVVSEVMTFAQVAETFTEVLGKKVVYNAVDPSVYAKFGFPGAEDLANMFHFNRDYKEFREMRDLNKIKQRVPDVIPLKTWIEQNKAAFL